MGQVPTHRTLGWEHLERRNCVMPEFRVTLAPSKGGGDWVVALDRERLTVHNPGGILWTGRIDPVDSSIP